MGDSSEANTPHRERPSALKDGAPCPPHSPTPHFSCREKPCSKLEAKQFPFALRKKQSGTQEASVGDAAHQQDTDSASSYVHTCKLQDVSSKSQHLCRQREGKAELQGHLHPGATEEPLRLERSTVAVQDQATAPESPAPRAAAATALEAAQLAGRQRLEMRCTAWWKQEGTSGVHLLQLCAPLR